MRLYTKYHARMVRKPESGALHWFLAAILVVFLVWVWWRNLQPSPRLGASEQDGRRQVTPVLHASRNGATNATATLVIAKTPATPPREVLSTPHAPRNAYELQLALARQGISCGSLDGVMGSQTRSALRAFQEREQLPVTGQLDSSTKARLFVSGLSDRQYTITPEDLAQISPVGTTWLAKSLQDRLEFENLLELLAERGHAHPNLIRMLNPSLDWNKVSVGHSVRLPDSEYPPVHTKAAFVRIKLADKTLQAFDQNTNLLAHFPCSIARIVEKRPVGKLAVTSIVFNPDYKFSPDIFPESEEARQLKRALMIPPGPNNPVGTAWIGLNRPGYGIHGTPRPEDVGRTESHGCFRLANWNADYLAQLVEIGMPVWVQP